MRGVLKSAPFFLGLQPNPAFRFLIANFTSNFTSIQIQIQGRGRRPTPTKGRPVAAAHWTPGLFHETPTASLLAGYVFQALPFTAQNVTAAPSPYFGFEP